MALATPSTRPKGFAGFKLGVSGATASVHLEVLTQAGFAAPQRAGKYTYFKRVEATFTAFARVLETL